MDATRANRLLPEVRWVGAVIVVVLVLAVSVLYVMPDETERFWAWTIQPRMTPLLMGAGYAAGAYFFTRVAAGTPWHRVARGFLPITVFTWLMGLATILHWDRFNHGHLAFWLWAGIYFVTPFLVPALWLRNRHQDLGTPEPVDVRVPSMARAAMSVVGLAIVVLGVGMFLRPGDVIPFWPWQVTPLTARVIAGFLALTGTSLVSVALDSRWSAQRVMLESLILGLVLILAGVARAWANFDPNELVRWAYVGGLSAGLAALIALYLAMELRRRRRINRNVSPSNFLLLLGCIAR
jgi:hypothetical protein